MDTYIGRTLLKMIKGDITSQKTEAIVNAANSSLLGGGGVDGAIHRVGGPKILAECIKIREKQGKCPTGQAVITSGGNLPAEYVIHTVGPVWTDGRRNEDALLSSAYKNSLAIAGAHGIRTISFPSISTGAYRFPVDRAARIALGTVRDYIKAGAEFEEIRFVLFLEGVLKEYQSAWRELETNGH